MPIGQRSAASGIGASSPIPPATAPAGLPAAPTPPATPTPPSAPAARHCWVLTDHGEVAALLVQWQAEPGGWRGRVVVADVHDATLTMNEFWVEADHLRPVRDAGSSAP